MARFFALSLRFLLPALAASLIPGLPALQAAPTDTPQPGAATPPADSRPAVTTTNSNKPGPPAVPAQDPFNRYGNILQPGVEPAHPLRLALPFPDVGEIKVPTPDELAMREKLEQLATLSDDQIRDQLSKWPPFTKMSLRDEGMMLARIQDFRDRRAKIAQQEAHSLGLLTLTPEQQARFTQVYWSKRLPMERDLAEQFEPILQQRQMEMGEELFREFAPSNGPATQPPAPPKTAPPPVTNQPAPVASTQTGAASSPSPGH
jgi:hypothetical protein